MLAVAAITPLAAAEELVIASITRFYDPDIRGYSGKQSLAPFVDMTGLTI